jgi:hypothetical protein
MKFFCGLWLAERGATDTQNVICRWAGGILFRVRYFWQTSRQIYVRSIAPVYAVRCIGPVWPGE